jgi:hypothetical protein
VVGRDDPHLRIASDLGAVDIVEDLGRAAEAQHLPLGDAGGAIVGDGAKPAQHRGRLRDGRERRRQRRGGKDIAPAASQAILGQTYHLDHALIGLARIGAESEDAVLQQDEAFDLGCCVVGLRRLPG